MDKHEFPSSQKGIPYIATKDGVYFAGQLVVGKVIAAEILRFAEREKELEAEVEAALLGQAQISESSGRAWELAQERERTLREALKEALDALETFRFAQSFSYGNTILRLRALLKED